MRNSGISGLALCAAGCTGITSPPAAQSGVPATVEAMPLVASGVAITQQPCETLHADVDGDGDVDLRDYAALQNCFGRTDE